MLSKPRVVWMPGGVRTEIHLDGEETGGRFCLLADWLPVGWSLPAHLHPDADESIHIIHGEVEIELDGTRSVLGAGQTIHIPRGVVHSSANRGAEIGQRLVIFSPAGMERFFLDIGADSAEAEFDLAAIATAARRHGWDFVRRRDSAH